MNLQQYRESRNTVSLDLEGKTKIETKDLIDTDLTITDWSMFKGKNGKTTAIVLVKEKPDNFLFAGTVLAGMLEDFQQDKELCDQVKKFGVKVHFSTAKSKDNVEYTNVEIVD